MLNSKLGHSRERVQTQAVVLNGGSNPAAQIHSDTQKLQPSLQQPLKLLTVVPLG